MTNQELETKVAAVILGRDAVSADLRAHRIIALVRGAIADAIETSMGSVAPARGLSQEALVTAYRNGLHDASLIARRAHLTAPRPVESGVDPSGTA